MKNKFNLSKEVIEIPDLDGEVFFLLEEDDINDIDELSEQEKAKIKNYLKELKEKSKESKNSEIIITKESTKEEVSYFLKNKFNFSQKAIESLELDGEILFSLEENDIHDVDELNEEEKIKFKNYLKKQKMEQNKKDKDENTNSKKGINPEKENDLNDQIV